MPIHNIRNAARKKEKIVYYMGLSEAGEKLEKLLKNVNFLTNYHCKHREIVIYLTRKMGEGLSFPVFPVF